jgi:hypothetical protein
VTKGRLVKAVGGTPNKMPLGFLASIGTDGGYERVRKREDEESRVE